jgi:hypothetical protein
MAALFEPDPKQIPARIRYAEQLILSRERELLSQKADFAEQRALNNSLHALKALYSCLNCAAAAAPWTRPSKFPPTDESQR